MLIIPTQISVYFEIIIMPEVCRDCLLTMKGVRVSSGRRQCIGFRKYSLACFQVFESKALDIGSEVRQLAEAAVSVTVKCANERCVS